MELYKIRYALARPVFQLLANMHWYKKGRGQTLRSLCSYAGLSEDTLSPEIQALLDKKVVSLSKVGGGYILKNSLAFTVLDYKEQDVREAYEHGVIAVVTNRPVPGKPYILVENPMFIYAKMARYFRSLHNVPVTAVVGSIGKTTTKLLLGAAYSKSGRTSCENGNFTNITHVLQLCQHINPKYEQLIFEISEANYGTIEAASIALYPKVAVITAMDLSHMEEYGDAEEIKRQVCSITKYMSDDGIVVVNKDDFNSYEYLNNRKVITVSMIEQADYFSRDIKVDEFGISFNLVDNHKGEVHNIFLKGVWGLHNVGMALQAYAAATSLGMETVKILKGLSTYRSQGIRQNGYWTLNGNLVYADCFNAVAKSVNSAINAANSIPIKDRGRRIAVIADIEEAGIVSEQIHDDIVEIINNSGFDVFIAYGPKLNKAIERGSVNANIKTVKCSEFSEVMVALKNNIKKGDLILFKSSHSWHLDRCIKRLWPISYYWRLLKEKLPYLLWRIGIEFH